MWRFIQRIIQLILSPARGWEDISAAVQRPEDIERNGFFPWIGIVAASEFLPLFYNPELSFFTALLSAIAVGGAMFASLFLSKLFLDITIYRNVDANINAVKLHTFAIYLLAINGLFIIFDNAMPASMTFLHFLPLISILVIVKSATYLGIRSDNMMTFLGISIIALIIIPVLLTALLRIII